MAKTVYFRWKEPREVKAWWKTTQKRLSKSVKIPFGFWDLAFLAALVWSILGNGFPRLQDSWFDITLLVFCIAIHFVPVKYLNYLMPTKDPVPAKYFVTPKGIHIANGIKRGWYRWEEIELYRLAATPFIAPNMTCLSFKSKRRNRAKWAQLYFDTTEIDEAKLRDVLEQHLPDKELQ